MSTCGVSKAMMDALLVAPANWTKVPEPFAHTRATLDALENRRLIGYRIGDNGFYYWRVTAAGSNFRRTFGSLKMMHHPWKEPARA